MTVCPSLPVPTILRPGDPIVFPDPRRADEDGLVAIGGDLSERRLLDAYANGIFPCYGSETPPLWWSPDPRAVIDQDGLHVARRLRRRMRRERFRMTWDLAFERVMRDCDRDRDDGSWILPEMIVAYVRLHRHCHAHSLEVWSGDQLVGGLYGVLVGRLFAAESMFHRTTDASKIALVVCVRTLFDQGLELFDVQYLTSHLESMGARAIPRDEYLERIAEVSAQPMPHVRL